MDKTQGMITGLADYTLSDLEALRSVRHHVGELALA
ncbi:hypothetical protein BH20ACT8_BH20ACT8_20420 [soil metagenome]|jgi:hypothetical protein